MSLMMTDPIPPPHHFWEALIQARFIHRYENKVYDFVLVEFMPVHGQDLETEARKALETKLKNEKSWLYNTGNYKNMKLESLIIIHRQPMV